MAGDKMKVCHPVGPVHFLGWLLLPGMKMLVGPQAFRRLQLFLLFQWMWLTLVAGTESDYSRIPYALHNLERSESLMPYIRIYSARPIDESATDVLKKNEFVSTSDFNLRQVDYFIQTVFWQKFSIFNDRINDSVFYLYNRNYSYWTLYELKADKIQFVAAAGKKAGIQERNVQEFPFACRISIPFGDTAVFLLKYPNSLYENNYGVLIASEKHFKNAFYPDMVNREKGLLRDLEGVLSGIFIIFSLYSFLLFIQTGKKLYLFYTIFQVFIYLPFAMQSWQYIFSSSMNYGLFAYLNLMQVLAYYFYFLFIENFLNVRKYSTLISKILYTGRVIVIVYFPLVTIFFFMRDSDFTIWIYGITRGLMLLTGFSAIVLSFYKTIPLSGYIAAGSLSLAVFAGLKWLIVSVEALSKFSQLPTMEVGILIELLCFTLGLGAYSMREEKLKVKFQTDLIRSLESNKKLQEENLRSIVETQERERSRIGRDLHDDVGAQLSTLKMFLGSMMTRPEKERLELHNYTSAILDTTIHDIRNIIVNLSPKVLEEFGYAKAVEELINRYRNSSILRFELSIHGMERRLEPLLENTLYRITQELINNSLKYSWASVIILDVMLRDGKIILMYEDDGRGCDIEKATKGFGLTNIRTRTQMFNGEVYFDSAPGKGFRCELEMKL